MRIALKPSSRLSGLLLLVVAAGLIGAADFVHAADRAELESVYAELDRLAPRAVETLSHRPQRDLFFWPLGAALVQTMFSLLILASALAWILFLIILVLTLLVVRSADRWVYYEGGGQ